MLEVGRKVNENCSQQTTILSQRSQSHEAYTEYCLARLSPRQLDCIDDKKSKTKIADCLPQTEEIKKCDREGEMQELVDKSRAKIIYGGNSAYYLPGKDEIHLPHRHQFSSSDRYWAVKFHELGHWSGAEDRLARKLSTDKDSDDYCFEELIADLAASFLGYEFGLADTQLEHHGSYLEHYWKLLNSDPRIFFKAAYEAQKAANYLIGIE